MTFTINKLLFIVLRSTLEVKLTLHMLFEELLKIEFFSLRTYAVLAERHLIPRSQTIIAQVQPQHQKRRTQIIQAQETVKFLFLSLFIKKEEKLLLCPFFRVFLRHNAINF